MTTKLALYNNALGHIGERMLSSLTEAREPRRRLDAVYDNALLYVLEQGWWKFAQRTVKIPYSASVTPAFGYERAYEKPTDYVRAYRLAQDEFLKVPLVEYMDEGDFWYGHHDEIYVTYVSKDAAYGLDLSKWPPAFTLYVELYLALRIAPRITPAEDVGKTGNNNLERMCKTALTDAQSKDAIAGSVQFTPQGMWSSSRGGRPSNGGRRDRGGRGSLIG